MSDTVDTGGTTSEGEKITVDEALVSLAGFISYISGEETARSAVSVTMDELRNRAIYQLNREVLDESNSETVGTEDSTLPYVDSTGSELDIVLTMADNVTAAIDMIIENKAEYQVIDDPQEDE
tara:strand:- start:20 stop:388 length:369 start_codon:yes stop_codon:yes gene_type:complete